MRDGDKPFARNQPSIRLSEAAASPTNQRLVIQCFDGNTREAIGRSGTAAVGKYKV